MYWLSDVEIWIPLYVLLIFLIIRSYKKKAILILVMGLALVGTTDQVSRGFKYGVERYRPCRPESAHQPKAITIDNHCGGKYGFFSGHAANTFGVALFFGTLLTIRFKRIKILLLLWATAVSYSRIYLGVHYPLDILVGAFSGLLFASLYLKLTKYFLPKVLN